MAETPVCLACGGIVTHFADARDVEYYSVPDTFGYYRCSNCQSLSIFPVPESRLGEIYPSTYYSLSADKGSSFANSIKVALDRKLFKTVFRRIGDKDSYSALDVGGGTGWLLAQAKRAEPRLKRTMIVDIDANAREAALRAGH